MIIKRLYRAIKTVRKKHHAPLHIEFNLTDYCNLNCKGCSHYSPIAPAEYQGLAELQRSMRCISQAKNADIIEGIYLIGGETLLYPDLIEAMKLGRKYFPKAKISIFTNGLLIPKMSNEFWEVCRETGSVMAITRYPIKFDYDKAEALCKDHGVAVEIFGDRSEDNSFFRLPLDPEKKQNGRFNHFRCISFGCVTVDDGKIFPCSQSACVKHLNRKFGTDFKWEEGDYIKVEDLKDVKEIDRLRKHPVPFCNYCKRHEVVAHGPSRRHPSEWIDQKKDS